MAVSVRNNMAVSALPAYFTNRPNPHFNTHNRPLPAAHFRQFRPHPYQTMPMMHAQNTASLGLDDNHPSPHGQQGLFVNTDNDHNNTTQTPVGSFFEDSFNYPDEQNEQGAVHQWRDRQPQETFHMPFASVDSVTSSFGSSGSSFNSSFDGSDIFGDMNQPRKVENSPMLPAWPTLPHIVDTAMYENVENEDWGMASVEYGAPSPSSVAASSNGPLTPTGSDGSEWFGRSFSFDGLPSTDTKVNTDTVSLPAVDASRTSFSGACQCPTCRGSSVERASLAQIWNAAQPQLPADSTKSSHHLSISDHGHNELYNGTHRIGASTVIAPPAAPSINTQDLTNMLDCQRSAMETTPEGSDSSDGEDSDDGSDADVNDQAVAEAAHRRERDRFLLKMRAKGLSYKEIKRRGRFTEAESTLRGRVRVLTKDKSERVRKPEWTTKDLQLLNHAVDRYAYSDDLGEVSTRDSHGRIPWKKISLWMQSNGSSYHFAAATCAKKWREMN